MLRDHLSYWDGTMHHVDETRRPLGASRHQPSECSARQHHNQVPIPRTAAQIIAKRGLRTSRDDTKGGLGRWGNGWTQGPGVGGGGGGSTTPINVLARPSTFIVLGFFTRLNLNGPAGCLDQGEHLADGKWRPLVRFVNLECRAEQFRS